MFSGNPPIVNSIVDYEKVTEQLLSESWNWSCSAECVDCVYEKFLNFLNYALESATKTTNLNNNHQIK